MPIFNYKVRDKYGLSIKSRVEGENESVVSQNLKSLNYSILYVTPITPFEEKLIDLKNKLKKPSQKDILLITRQLASMIHAGLPILTCLHNIILQTNNTQLKKILEQIALDIEGGSSFAHAVEKHPKFFPGFYVSMINVGEVSGRLDEVLNRLVNIGKQEAEIKAKITGAMLYPIILLCLSFTVVGFLLVFVLPKFIVVYNSLDVKLPTPTIILLTLSSFLKNFWWLVLAGVMSGVYFFNHYKQTPQGRFNIDQYFLKIPILGQLSLKYNLARFSRTMGSLLKSGIAVLQAIAVTETTVTNNVLKTILADLKSSILEGKTLSEQLKLSGLFPPMIIQMISAGEQTGRLDDMLMDVADFYDIEVDYEIKNLTSFIEPMLLIFMGGMVLFMALAVLKPIFDLTKVIRK